MDIEIKKILEYFRPISEKYNHEKSKQEGKEINIFQLISNIYHRENLHTDILYFLLDGDHDYKKEFLKLFLEYLYKFHEVEKVDYKVCEVKKERPTLNIENNERGRIDILIKRDERFIIIENKINNAPDTPNQLVKYVNYCKIEKVDAIIYLSMDGSKYPDKNWNVSEKEKIEISGKIKQVAAFNNNKQDLYKGWLSTCIGKTNESDDVKFILKHYRGLLKILDNNMNTLTEPQNEFYEEITKNKDIYEVALTIKHFLSNGLSIFFASKFKEQFKDGDYLPFKNPEIVAGNQLIFDGLKFEISGSNYYLRISFKDEIQQFCVEFLDRDQKWDQGDRTSLLKILEHHGFANEIYKWYSFEEKDELPNKIKSLLKDFKKVS